LSGKLPEPDFALRIVPSTINVRAGSSATLTAYALRRDGFNGEIVLGLKDAPRGYSIFDAKQDRAIKVMLKP